MRIDIVGAGIIGLACAEELLTRGHDVRIVDPAPGSGASYAAAGMVSPSGEAWFGEEELFRLGSASAALWPAYAARLGVDLTVTGTLLVAVDRADLQHVERHADLLAERGASVDLLSRSQIRAHEPGLGRVAGGALLPDDHAVDPRAVVAALRRRVAALGGRVVSTAPLAGRAASASERVETPDATLLATGARLPGPFAHLVRPVRGEILRLRSDDPPTHTLRGMVRGEQVYLVPRPRTGGPVELVVGATVEEHDGPAIVTAGGIARLLDAARTLLPAVDRAEFIEAIARDRPGTPDNLPLVGPTGLDGVLLAAGHYRHGVLLAPLTARFIADHLENGYVEPVLDPRRFDIERSTA